MALSPDGKVTKVVQFVYTISARRTMPRKKSKSSHFCVKLPDSSYKTGISFNGDSEIILGVYSDEYEFDTNDVTANSLTPCRSIINRRVTMREQVNT